MTPQIRNIILFGGIGLLLVFVYFTFIKSDSSTESTLVVSPAAGLPYTPSAGLGSNGASSVTSEFLSVLLNIKSIQLDDSIFSEPAFLTLKDSTKILVQDSTEGRPNPFAPIGIDSIPTSGSSSSSSSSSPSSSGSSSSGASTGGSSQGGSR